MRGFLINKNLCFYYWLRKKIGKVRAYRVSSTLEKAILIFGREQVGENREMEAYEFYWLDRKGRYQIIGVLPERRKNPARVTQESIMHWGKNIFCKELDTKDIYFIQVTINEDTGKMFRPTPVFITQK